MSALDIISRMVNPSDVRNILRSTPSYVTNRDRAGAVIQKGLDAYDGYQKAKPYLFWGSLVGAIAAAYYFEKRGRRPDNREAMVLYGASFAVCAATAIITRPGKGAVPADATPEEIEAASGDSALIGWVDTKVEELRAQDPNFADKAINRLVGMPGIKGQFQKMDPLIRAAVV